MSDDDKPLMPRQLTVTLASQITTTWLVDAPDDFDTDDPNAVLELAFAEEGRLLLSTEVTAAAKVVGDEPSISA